MHLKAGVVGWDRDKWVPVTTAWRFLGLRMDERPLLWRVAAIILNKQLRAADKGWSSSMVFRLRTYHVAKLLQRKPQT
jgi:hypothetical protein